jgi:aminoglycoside phosphotransferase (APT) family kinase protein
VDWRFLLPDPELRRIAIVGEASPALRQALELFGEEVGTGREAPELVVGAAAGPRELRAAAKLVPPGGRLYAELRGPLPRPGRALALLQELGFREAVAHWHLPSFERAQEIVPLACDEVVRHVLERHGDRIRVPGRALLRAGLLGRLAPCVCVLARRVEGDPGQPSPNAGLARLASAGVDVPAEACSLLVTPRFAASRHVVFLIFGPAEDQPELVVKLPRLSGDVAGIEREAESLRALGRLGQSGFDGAPRLLAFEREAGEELLAESAVVGAPLSPSEVRRAPESSVSSVAELLVQMALADRRPASADPGWFERLLGDPLRRFAAAFDGGDEARLVDRTLELVAPLRECELSLVLEHGDVSHPNLVRLRNGRVALVDWELSEPRGLPTHDLFLFLAYVAFALGRAKSNERRTELFHETFFETGAPSATILAYAERVGVARSCLPALFVACWARYAATLTARLRGVGGVAAAPSASLRSHRNYLLWRHTVENAERLHLLRGKGS